jgi:hypothetical protein
MNDDAETLRACLDKLVELVELAEQIPSKDLARIENAVQVVSRAIQAVADAQQASEEAKLRVEEAKEVIRSLTDRTEDA